MLQKNYQMFEVKYVVAIRPAARHDCFALFIRQCHPKLEYQIH